MSEPLRGQKLAEMHDLLRQCGYDFNEVHPECYRNFSYVKLSELLQARAVPAQRPVNPGGDDRPIPSRGQISWRQLGRDVMDAMYAKRSDYEFDPSYYPGHQMLPPLNFNSLARIVDKYRYYGASPIPSTDRGTP